MTKTTEQQLHVLSVEECAEIGKRAEAATPGTHTAMWVPSGMPTECCKYGVVRPDGIEVARIWERTDVEFYANARTDIPNLLHTVESLREKLAAAQAVIARWVKLAQSLDVGNDCDDSCIRVLCDESANHGDALAAHDRETRNAAIEDAAKAVEQVMQHSPKYDRELIASTIRALVGKGGE